MNCKSVLILRPHKKDQGGVANYYNLVTKYFNFRKFVLEQFYIGSDNKICWQNKRIFKTIFDLYSLCSIFHKFDLIIINPSLDIKAVLRDGLFHLIAKYFYKRRTIVFFRGWTPNLENKIDKYGKTIFRIIFNSDVICVLSDKIKKKLIKWGCNPKKIIVETTTFEGYKNKRNLNLNKIVFLSRFVKNKGSLHAIKTIELLIPDFPSVHLFMAGDGELIRELLDYVKKNNLDGHVTFTGYVSGNKKNDVLSQCGIMLYPTFYGEGMPNSLLEGMGMGLVPVTRPVGGIPDIIKDGKNGFLVDSSDPEEFASRIRDLIKNPHIWRSMSNINFKEAWEKFEVRNVVIRLEKIYRESLNTL